VKTKLGKKLNGLLLALLMPVIPMLLLSACSENNAPAKPGAVKPAAPVAAPAKAASQASTADNAPPPWANSSAGMSAASSNANAAGGGTPAPATSLGKKGSQLSKTELDGIQTELLAAMQTQKPDTKRMIEILNRLKQSPDTKVSGINIDVLINNMEKSQQMQDLAAEIQKESTKPGGVDTKRLQEQVERLKKLQSQVRTDVLLPAASATNAAVPHASK
jgi:uncharacterized membrane protein